MARCPPDYFYSPACSTPLNELSDPQLEKYFKLRAKLRKKPGPDKAGRTVSWSDQKYGGCFSLTWPVPDHESNKSLIISYRYSGIFFLPTYTLQLLCVEWDNNDQ